MPLLAFAAPILSATLLAAPPPTEPTELWYALSLRDAHCGWMRSVEDTVDGALRLRSETHIELQRAGTSVTIELGSEFVETPDGRPLRLLVRTATGGPPVESEWLFPPSATVDGAPAAVHAIVRQGGSVREELLTYPPGPWLPPQAAERFFAARRAAGAKEITYEMIDGQAGIAPGKVTATFIDSGETTIDGRTIPISRWTLRSSLVPVDTVVSLSSDGRVVESSTMLGAEKMVARLADKKVAQRIKTGGPELMVSTMVAPDRPIPQAGSSRMLDYRVSVAPPGEGGLPALPSAGAQRFERLDADTGLLRVRVDEPLPAEIAEGDAEALARLLKPSSTIDSDDPLVRDLAAKALRGHEGESMAARAERLRRLVREHVRDKGLATAFASAGETARSREGDCSEHAVLLAALLRAAGIPARVAVGLVYADAFAGQRDVFAWHMWTQALVPGEAAANHPAGREPPAGGNQLVWLDLDATLPGAGRHHAAHILTAVSDLALGPMDPALAQVVPLLGRLRIEVLDPTEAPR